LDVCASGGIAGCAAAALARGHDIRRVPDSR